MLSWEDYYKDEAPVKKEETNKPEPRLSEVTETKTVQEQTVQTEMVFRVSCFMTLQYIGRHPKRR